MSRPFGESEFGVWLERQRDRRDPVGDFARDRWEDEGLPHQLGSEQDLVSFMESRGAGDASVEAARQAWAEFGMHAEDYTPSDDIVDLPDDDRD